MTGSGVCVVTVATDDYLPGTLVALSSFLAHNPWFDGDVKIIGDALSDASRARLHCICPAADIVPVGSALRDRIDAVVGVRPQYSAHRARFHSLEAFGLAGYRKILFIDSDLLFRGSVESLFELDQPLIACGDRAWFGEVRHAWLPDDEASQPFNAGLMLADETMIGNDSYRRLVALVDADTYRNPEIRHADQYVLNTLFAHCVTIADSSFNYLLGHLQVMQDHVETGMSAARVLHFNGPIKPWQPEQAMRATLRRPELAAAFGYWYAAWTDCLGQMALQSIRSDR